ncbi:MAG TPA: DUF4375 domain-containing protein [Phycisphaerales bacterium]|nr:DUF4375 domain-containing protein [Phycisphaerales bacterium]
MSASFGDVYQEIMSRWHDDAMTGLSSRERDFVIAHVCLNQSLNGSLTAYYESSYGDRAAEVPGAFTRMGVAQAAEIVRQANKLMGGPAADEVARGERLEALSEAAVERLVALSDELNAMQAMIERATLAYVRGV